MQKTFTFFFLSIFLSFNYLTAQNERYLDEIFTGVNVESGIEYAENYSLITGASVLDTLVFDLYTADGDTETNRPVVILWTGGNFLPQTLNGTPLGAQDDYANVELAHRLAKRGYVAVIPTYRQGWNPVGGLDARVGTLIRAIYRGVQDSRAMVRYLRKSIVEEGNPYGICYDKMVQWGVGDGGTIAANSTTLDSHEDLQIEKFTDIQAGQNPPVYHIQLDIDSDPSGLIETPQNRVNHLGYPDEVALSVNMGGILADTSFLDSSDPPMICFATPSYSRLPYNTDLWVGLVGETLFEMTGSYDIIERAQELGVNDVFSSVSDDPFSTAAAYTASHPNNPNVTVSGPEGLNGLMPFNRPIWMNPFSTGNAPETAPWDYWDAEYWSTVPHPSCPFNLPIEECNFHIVNTISNQDMSLEKSNIYLDSVMGYVLPRAYLALNLSENITCSTATEDLVEKNTIDLQIFPNPVSSILNVRVASEYEILEASLYSLEGKKIANFSPINAHEFRINRGSIATGIYFVKVRLEEGVEVQKVVFER